VNVLKHLTEFVWLVIALTLGVLMAAQIVAWLWQWAQWQPGPLIR